MIKKVKEFNHVYFLGFSVNSNDKENPTEEEIRQALIRRVSDLLDPNQKIELRQELDGPHDTTKEDDDEDDEPSDQEMMAAFGTKWHDGL